MPQPLQTPAVPSPQWAPPTPPLSLPPEVLEAPATPPDAGWVFIERMDEWRRAMGWTHKEFAAHLGITLRYWHFMLRHEKELTISVAQRVLTERPELGFILGDPAKYFWERSKRRKPRSPRQEATPGGG